MARWLYAALLALPIWLAGGAGAATPDAIARATAEANQECRQAGGRPSLTPGYQTTVELNGDGQPDFIIDVTGFNCAGAVSLFCGSAGCPLSVYLSGPGGVRQAFNTQAQAWSLDRRASPPVLVLSMHGSACGRVGSAPCEQRYAWNGQSFAALGRGRGGAPASVPNGPVPNGPVPNGPVPKGPAPAASKPLAPGAGASAGPGAGPGVAPGGAPTPGGWQIQAVANNPQVAMVAGPGAIQSIGFLCNQGVPVAALMLRAKPPWPDVVLSVATPQGSADVPIRQAPNGGAAWYADLRGSALPRLLAGPAGSATLRMNGGQQGSLALLGASAALRSALGGCYRF